MMASGIEDAWQHFLRLNHSPDPGITCVVVDAPPLCNEDIESQIQNIIQNMDKDKWQCTYAKFHSEFVNFQCMLACSKVQRDREYHLLHMDGKLMCGYTTSLGTKNIKHLCTWFGNDPKFMEKLPSTIGKGEYIWAEMAIYGKKRGGDKPVINPV